MNRRNSKRSRGVILTLQGWQKLQKGKLEWEFREKSGMKYTVEEISERAELTPNTVAKVLARQEGVDKQTLVRFFMAFDLELKKSDYSKSNPNSASLQGLKTLKRIDWDEAVCVSDFCGRTTELAMLEQWLLTEQCRVVALLGMGGIGKTSVAAKLVHEIQEQFEYVVWRSLYNAPPLFELLANLIQFFCDAQICEADLPKSVDGRLSQLISYLRQYHCLIILDNAQTILQSGAIAGSYREDYEDYGQLIKRVGQTIHQSCLVLTSREKPKDVALLEGEALPVRSLHLRGLCEEEGERILRHKGLSGEDSKKKALFERYCGNPLALKIVATTIQDVFNGNISEFLNQEIAVFGDITTLLDQQFERLSDKEREVMYWFCINREPMTLFQLREDIISIGTPQRLLEALESLVRRSLIDKATPTQVEKSTRLFTIEPVLMEYVTSKLIKQVCEEIVTQQIVLLRHHALSKAQSKEYVRVAQIRFILKPLIDELLTIFKTQKRLEHQLVEIKALLQKEFLQERGYTGGNIINMLSQLKIDLRGYDFSNMSIWQADLRGVNLPQVNFQNANLSKSVFTKNFSRVSAVAFSPNGKVLAMSDANGKICLWQDFTDSEELLTCQGHISWVRAIAFSPDGDTISSSGADQSVKLWDTSSGECLKTFTRHPKRVQTVAFSSKGNILACGSDDQTVSLWDLRSSQCHKILQGHTGRVLSVVFSPQGKILATASSDKTLKLWNFTTSECKITLQGHTGSISSVTFSLDGKTLASASDDQTVKLWDAITGEYLRTLQGHSNRVRSVTFAPKGKMLASGSDDQTVKLWDHTTGECLMTLQGHTGLIWSLAFSPEGNILASGSDDQTVKLWDVSTGQTLRILQGYSNGVMSVAFAPSGKTFVSSSDDQTVRCWDVSTGQCNKTLLGHANRVRTVAFSPEGNILATGSYDQEVRLWNTSTNQCYKILQGHTGWVKAVAFAPEGNILASGSDDQTVRLWDVSTGELLRTLEHSHGVWSVAFSPVSDRRSRAVGIASAFGAAVPQAQEIGNILASGCDDQTVRLWDVSTGQTLKNLLGHSGWVLSVAFSPQGRILASGSKDKTVKFWDVGTGECLKTLSGHTSWVLSVAFSPQGNILASGSVDQMVKLWDINSGECLKTLQGHTHWVRSVVFCPDGKTLLSGSEDGTVKLWDVLTGECLKTFRNERPLEGMNITGVIGLTQATIASLKALGAMTN
ncbi:MAG: pentapeptide repeat-containing protein [Brasilonema angustatum HA4187-MV1]|jgi:WD40 repeat protein|nr:pentapeptide repeat-containing protein [Brasilonema angustatum HA4187-MV1]